MLDERVQKECPDIKAVLVNRNLFETINETLTLEEIKTLGIEENMYELIECSARFDLAHRFDVIKNFVN